MNFTCDICEGTGKIEMKLLDHNGKELSTLHFDCYKCNCKGYLDWIDIIVPNIEVDFLQNFSSSKNTTLK